MRICEERAQLHRQRHAHFSAHLPHDLFHLGFNGGAAQVGIGGQGKNVQLDGTGARPLQLPGNVHPTPGVLAVEAGNHRDRELGPGLLQMAQVEPCAHMEQGGIRHVAQRFAIAFTSLQAQVVQVELFLLQLFLKQGMEHDGGSSCLLQLQQLG